MQRRPVFTTTSTSALALPPRWVGAQAAFEAGPLNRPMNRPMNMPISVPVLPTLPAVEAIGVVEDHNPIRQVPGFEPHSTGTALNRRNPAPTHTVFFDHGQR
jgi:hypothetical protein